MQAIIIAIVCIVFIFIILAIEGVVNSRKPYACPNCGHIFTKKWYALMFRSSPPVKDGSGELRLKCPACKKVDFCVHTNYE